MTAPPPATVHQAVHDVLAQSRYSALHQGPSLTDLLGRLVLRALAWLVTHVAAAVTGGVGLVVVAFAIALAGLIGFQVVRTSFWAGRRQAQPGGRSALRAGDLDHFAAADRLAQAGDVEGALRALAAAVATALGGTRAWEASPLTVREIFDRATDAHALRALLLPFEAAEYGARPPTLDDYRLASAAAAPYREGRVAA